MLCGSVENSESILYKKNHKGSQPHDSEPFITELS